MDAEPDFDPEATLDEEGNEAAGPVIEAREFPTCDNENEGIIDLLAEEGRYLGNYSKVRANLGKVDEREFRKAIQQEMESRKKIERDKRKQELEKADRAACDATARRMITEAALRCGLADPFREMTVEELREWYQEQRRRPEDDSGGHESI